jgi:FKBP-type peptidyl-prolyl cis-trans isomerase FklB
MLQRILTVLFIATGGLLIASCSKPSPQPASEAGYTLSAESNQKFLADNVAKKGVITLPSGLQYRVIKSGSGKMPKSPEDLVTVTYKGWLITGKIFDQTQPGQTAQFPAGHLIPGWVEALKLMKEGDEWELVIPSDLGYGADGAGDSIPPNQTLVFDMTLIGVTPAQ